jgi:hypothetical protein
VVIKRNLAVEGLLILSLAASGCAAALRSASPAPAPSRVGVDVSIFYDELAPYGDWLQLAEYGWVWIPAGVEVGWRPYTDGYWVLTDYGWTWVSNWRWGWAPFHYGRWVLHGRHGWVWIPGRVWGPAWVVWRYGPGWVGWAPMPPHAGWRVGMEFRVAGDFDLLVAAHWYSFVPENRFIERNLRSHFAIAARNVTLMRATRNATNYVMVENRIVNRSIDARQIERATGRRIAEGRVVDGRPGATERRGSDVAVYRPDIGARAPDRTPPRDTQPPRRAVPRDEQQRREDQEKQELQREQERERQRLDALHRDEQRRSAVPRDRTQLERQQEAERRAQSDQRRREEAVLKDRQDRRRQKEEPRSETPQRRPPGRGK